MCQCPNNLVSKTSHKNSLPPAKLNYWQSVYKIIVTIQSLLSQNLWFYSMWRIRQITLCKDMFMNASIHHISLIKLLGSEPLQIILFSPFIFQENNCDRPKNIVYYYI